MERAVRSYEKKIDEEKSKATEYTDMNLNRHNTSNLNALETNDTDSVTETYTLPLCNLVFKWTENDKIHMIECYTTFYNNLIKHMLFLEHGVHEGKIIEFNEKQKIAYRIFVIDLIRRLLSEAYDEI